MKKQDRRIDALQGPSFSDTAFATKEISGVGRVQTVQLLRGRTARFLNTVGRALSYSSTRAYGAFFLAFGLITLLFHFGEYYFLENPEVAVTTIITGISLVLVSIPLLIFDRPMCIALQDFFLTDYIFFEFFSIKRMHRIAVKEHVSPLIAFFIGFVPAIVGFFLPVQYVVAVLAIIVFVLVAFTTPEFPMIFGLLVLPYVSVLEYGSLVLVALASITFLSYAFKVVVGKRVYNFDVYGILLFIFIFLSFLSGIFGKSPVSLNNSLVFIVVVLAYFPISNLVVNRRLAECVVNSVVVSAVPIAILSIIEYIAEHPKTSFIPPEYVTAGTSALFESPAMLAAFMLTAAVVTLSLIIDEPDRIKGALYSFVFLLEAVSLVLTMQPIAWLSALLAASVYPLLVSRRAPADLISLLIFSLPFIFLLPVAFLTILSDATSMTPTFAECIIGFGAALNLFFENVIIGIGIGKESYAIVTGGQERLTNTFLGIALEMGIVALAVFVVIIILHLRHVSHYRRYTRISPMGSIVNVSTLAVIALLLFGSGSYIFENLSITYIFFSMLGISSAALGVAKKEYDDRRAYYGDTGSSEAAAIDVHV